MTFRGHSPLFSKMSKFSQAHNFWWVRLIFMKLIYLKSALKCDSFYVCIGIKILFCRVLVTIEPGRSLLQFVTTNCLISCSPMFLVSSVGTLNRNISNCCTLSQSPYQICKKTTAKKQLKLVGPEFVLFSIEYFWIFLRKTWLLKFFKNNYHSISTAVIF